MEAIPWFAWIAIVAIVIWGMVMIFGKSSNLSNHSAQIADHQRELDQLNQRVRDLETRLNRT